MSVLYMKTKKIMNSNALFPAADILVIESNMYKHNRIPPRLVLHCKVFCKTLHIYSTIHT